MQSPSQMENSGILSEHPSSERPGCGSGIYDKDVRMNRIPGVRRIHSAFRQSASPNERGSFLNGYREANDLCG